MINFLLNLGKKYNFKFIIEKSILKLSDLTKKYNSNDEIVKEIFKLNENEGLRYDLTVPLLSRIHDKIQKPEKRMSFGSVFRNGPVTAYRHRQFTQFDFDVVYKKKEEKNSFLEILFMLKNLIDFSKKKIIIYVNDQNLLNKASIDLEIEDPGKYYRALDKIEKKTIEEIIISDKLEKKIFLKFIEKLNHNQFSKNINIAKSILKNNMVFKPMLSRGLNFYNGLFFEGYFEKEPHSILGGGFYSGNVFQKNSQCIGFSIGLQRFNFENEKVNNKIIIDSKSFNYDYAAIFNKINFEFSSAANISLIEADYFTVRLIKKPFFVLSNDQNFLKIKNIVQKTPGLFFVN